MQGDRVVYNQLGPDWWPPSCNWHWVSAQKCS